MRKYLLVATVAAIISGGLVSFTSNQLGASDTTSKSQELKTELTADLANDPSFIASIQSRVEPTSIATTPTIKGDKGDKGDAGLVGSTGAMGTAGNNGIAGNAGLNGIDGLRGPKGDKGDTGDAGPQGSPGLVGATGATGATGLTGATGAQGIQGEAGVVAVTASGLTYNSTSQTIALTTGYVIPPSASASDWNAAYLWGNHATAGYAVLDGKSGGQQLIGGLEANQSLTLQANSANSGNTATTAAITLKVGDSGAVSALSIRHNGNVGIGTTTPANKLTVAGDIAITTNGSDAIKPVQFVQMTGLGDNASLTAFNGVSYPTSDWNPAVVGLSTGGGCGTPWSSTNSLNGFKYWWDASGGNWRLTIDMNAPNDGCNFVQVMFVRKELSNRANYGF